MDIQKPKKWKSILAWISIIFGGIGVLSSFGGDSAADIVGGIILGLALLLPGAWWMFCNIRDQKAASAYATSMAQHEQLSGFLKDSDPTIVAGMGTPERPQVGKRRWGAVTAATIAMFMIGATVTPTPETTAEVTEPAATTSATASPTSSATPTTSTKPSTSSSTSTRETTSITTSSEEPTPVQQNFAEIPETVVPVVEPVVEETPAPAPAPAPVIEQAPVIQEAPAPAPAPAARTVTGGAFCKNAEQGQIGYTVTGLQMTCTREAGENRSRWR